MFTNIWLHDLERITDPIHQALSRAAFYFVRLLNLVVSMAACYVEEDFVCALTFEYPQSLVFDNVIAQLRSIEETVVARIKAKQNKQENTALLNRIRFYQHILFAFDELVPLNDREAPSDDRKWQPQINVAKSTLKHILSHMQNARDTIKLGRQPPNGNDGNCYSGHSPSTCLLLGDYSWLSCFQPKVNQHKLPPTFPREIRFMSRTDGYEYMINMFQSVLNMIEEIPEAYNIISLDTLIVSLLIDLLN